VSNAKSLLGKGYGSFTDYPTKEVEATISFINPEINLDSRLLLIGMEIANQTCFKTRNAGSGKINSIIGKDYLFQ
jgi:Cu(I)/Ag(I) efflux system membrane fusion protein